MADRRLASTGSGPCVTSWKRPSPRSPRRPHVAGAGVARLANTSCLTMPGVANQIQLIDLDLAGIAVSAGSACSSGKVGPSHVLAAMGLGLEEAQTAIRVSLGWASTDARRRALRRGLGPAVRAHPG